jgi:archaetidylinositol phosphate synthase
MLETYLRAPIQRVAVDPIAKRLSLSPSVLTICAMALGLIGMGMLFFKAIFLGLFFFSVAGFFDILDGSVARMHQKTSAMGTVLDLTLDRVVEVAMVFSLYFLGEGRDLYCLMMLASMYICVASFFSVTLFDSQRKSSPHKKSFAYSPGLVERAETFAFFFLMVLFESQFKLLAFAYTALTLLTACIRLIEFKRSA